MSIQAATATTVIHRAYRLTLDPTPQQVQRLSQCAGAARYTYNHAIGAKQASHRLWLQEVAFATYEQALTEDQARNLFESLFPLRMASTPGSPKHETPTVTPPRREYFYLAVANENMSRGSMQ